MSAICDVERGRVRLWLTLTPEVRIIFECAGMTRTLGLSWQESSLRSRQRPCAPLRRQLGRSPQARRWARRLDPIQAPRWEGLHLPFFNARGRIAND